MIHFLIFLREIQNCELAVVFLCGPVVGFGRLPLITERAQLFSIAVVGDRYAPKSCSLIERNTFVAGAAPGPFRIPGVLSDCSNTQVGFAVIKTVVVNMIDNHIIGGFEYRAVHGKPVPFAFYKNRANRVEGRAAIDNIPFTFGKPKIIIRIDDSVLAPRKQYPAKSIAVANPPI